MWYNIGVDTIYYGDYMTVEEKRKAYKLKWAQENKERLAIKQKEWLLNNPEKRKQAVKKYKAANPEQGYKYILDNYEWYLFNAIRNRCRILNIEFTLSLEDIKIPEKCPYLQVPLTRIRGKGRQDYNPSTDRKDPTKGYISGNIEIISDKANRMKNNATQEELLVFAKSILDRSKKGDEDTDADQRHGKREVLINAAMARYEDI